MAIDATRRLERELFVRALSFSRADSPMAGQIAEAMRDAFYPKGAEIYARGSAARFMYWITSGSVDLVAPDAETWKFEDNAVIGVMDAILDRPYSRTAVAVTDVQALTVPTDEYFDILEDNFEEAYRLIAFISGTLTELGRSLPNDGFLAANEVDPTKIHDATHQLSMVERLLALREVPSLSTAPIQALVTLAEVARQHRWEPGETIMVEGEPRTHFIYMVEGRAVATRTGSDARPAFGPSTLLLGWAALASETNAYTVTAETPVIALEINAEELADVMEDFFDVGQAIWRFCTIARERIQNQLAVQGKLPT